MPHLHRVLSGSIVMAVICSVALAFSLSMYPTNAHAAPEGSATVGSFSTYVSDAGTITRPVNVRTEWAHLGNWAVPDGEALQFHEVYAEASTVDYYRQTGAFPDGATLVKEVRATAAKDMTTGHPSWATDPILWFVMVKDVEGRFPENPNWGEGWGWALYKADNPTQNVSTDFRADCLSCHLPAQATDYIYSFAYPTLTQ